MAKLNELYIFFPPRRSEYMLCCLCINFVFSYVLTSDNEIYAVEIQKALSSSSAMTLISTVDARGFSGSSLGLASSLCRMKYVRVAGVVGRNRMITENPEEEASLDNSNIYHDNNFLLQFDLFLIFFRLVIFCQVKKDFQGT